MAGCDARVLDHGVVAHDRQRAILRQSRAGRSRCDARRGSGRPAGIGQGRRQRVRRARGIRPRVARRHRIPGARLARSDGCSARRGVRPRARRAASRAAGRLRGPSDDFSAERPPTDGATIGPRSFATDLVPHGDPQLIDCRRRAVIDAVRACSADIARAQRRAWRPVVGRGHARSASGRLRSDGRSAIAKRPCDDAFVRRLRRALPPRDVSACPLPPRPRLRRGVQPLSRPTVSTFGASYLSHAEALIARILQTVATAEDGSSTSTRSGRATARKLVAYNDNPTNAFPLPPVSSLIDPTTGDRIVANLNGNDASTRARLRRIRGAAAGKSDPIAFAGQPELASGEPPAGAAGRTRVQPGQQLCVPEQRDERRVHVRAARTRREHRDFTARLIRGARHIGHRTASSSCSSRAASGGYALFLANVAKVAQGARACAAHRCDVLGAAREVPSRAAPSSCSPRCRAPSAAGTGPARHRDHRHLGVSH